MPQPPATPGVYVNEIASQSKPIEGVGTSIAAFVGLAPWGPANTPTRVTSWTEFARTFGVPHTKETPNGPFMEGAYLAHAVFGFFQNGGGACWIVRVGPSTYGTVPQAALPGPSDEVAYRVLLKEGVDPGGEPASVVVTHDEPAAPAAGRAGDGRGGDEPAAPAPAWTPAPTFALRVTKGDADPEVYEGLTVTHGPSYVVTKVNAASELIRIVEGGAPAVPADGTYAVAVPDAAAEPPAQLTDLSDEAAPGSGLGALALMDEITMVCVPDLMSIATSDTDIRTIHTALADTCAAGRRMAILDPPQGLGAQEIAAWQQGTETPSTAFATLYWPWIRVMNPLDGHLVEVPPCGHVAGVWARTDATRGVFKAPANEVVMGAVELAADVDDAGQDPLNRNGVNCIRGFPGRGIRTWGARTLATDADPEWKYLNVRRLFNYLTASIAHGTSWAVFEPNDELLWGQLRLAVANFLTGVWRSGGLFGRTPDEAFFVKCDAETNPQDLIDAGQVNIQVGVAPVEPAEFVIFQVSQHRPAA